MATVEQITKELLTWASAEEGEEFDYFESAADCIYDALDSGYIDLPSGKASYVECFGGEGKGDDYWMVFSVGEQLFRFAGYHDSWSGVSWDGTELEEVEAKEVITVKYVKKAKN